MDLGDPEPSAIDRRHRLRRRNRRNKKSTALRINRSYFPLRSQKVEACSIFSKKVKFVDFDLVIFMKAHTYGNMFLTASLRGRLETYS